MKDEILADLVKAAMERHSDVPKLIAKELETRLVAEGKAHRCTGCGWLVPTGPPCPVCSQLLTE